jgi:hypothetical protein
MNKWLILFGAGVQLGVGTSVTGGQTTLVPAASAKSPIGITAEEARPADSVVRRPRPKAIEYSDWYARRLTIHKVGSYVMLPLFGTEYYLGERLIDGRASQGERSVHVGVATAIGGLFAINTVTGAWNLWDSRKDPTGRTKRFVHAALMLSADAGFALAAAAAGDDGGEDASTHKTIALTSIGISTVGTALMWFWKN